MYYIAPPDPSWSAAEQRDYLPGQADLLFTSVHEVWPGHFLQFLHSNRNPSLVGRLFVGYAFAEGWAHYAEEMMWEMGLGNGDPETHIGQLTNALLRNVRFLSTIGLHTKGMTWPNPKRCSGSRALRTSAPRASRRRAAPMIPPTSITRRFHDQFLTYGGPPIPMVRQQMLGEGGSLF